MNNIFEKINLIQKLHAAGLLTNEQGTELLNIVANNSYSLKNPAVAQPNSPEAFINYNKPNNTIKTDEKDINKQVEDFYNSLARKNLKDYIQKSLKINNFDERMFKEMVQNLEKDAVAAHMREQKYAENLARSNDIAKGRLTSQTQTAANLDIKPDKIYTRKEIDSMSMEEFNANESQIMHQMEQGLIQ